MKKIQHLLCVALAFVFVFSLAVCGADAATGSKFKIMASTRNMVNQYWVEWNEGGLEASEALGVEYNLVSAEDDEQKQIADIETGIANGIDALVVMPVNNALLTSIADMCEYNKVPFVAMWDIDESQNPDDYEYWIAQVTQDASMQGYNEAIELFKAMGGKGNIVALEGIPGLQTSNDRRKGLEKAMSENPDIKLLGADTGMFNRTKSLAVMESFISNYGSQINGVWTANDDMSIGAIEAIKSAGLKDVKVGGIDATVEVVKAIIDGDAVVTLGGDAKGMHGLGIMTAFDALNGEWPSKGDKMIFWKPPVVTPANAAQYYKDNFTDAYPGHPWQEMSKTYNKQ